MKSGPVRAIARELVGRLIARRMGCNPPANDSYCPDDPVTRQQMASFLARALADD